LRAAIPIITTSDSSDFYILLSSVFFVFIFLSIQAVDISVINLFVTEIICLVILIDTVW
jgi:hypothetical protein